MIMIAVLHGSFWWLSFRCCFHWLVVYTNKDDSLILTKGQNASKIVLLKNWNCFKISRTWRNSHLSVMHFGQKFQWVLLLQGCFNTQNVIPCSCQRYCFWQGSFWRLSKRKRKILHYAFGHTFDLVMLCSILSCFSWHILLQWQEFWVLQFIPHVLGQKVKFTIYLSLFTVTIHCHYSPLLFTPNFCLFKGGCPLYLKQVFSVLSSGLLS